MNNLITLRQKSACLIFCLFFVLFCSMGCHYINSLIPSPRGLFEYRFMKAEWETYVREVVKGSERQDLVLQKGLITRKGFIKLKKEAIQIKKDYIAALACYDCDIEDFDPILERIRKINETAITLALDMMEGLQEVTTEEELSELIKRLRS